jgi:hypothetical protein
MMPPPSHRTALPKTVLVIVLVWTAVSALGALQTYSDNLRGGVAGGDNYARLFLRWFIEYAVPQMVLSLVLTQLLARWPGLIRRPLQVLLLFVAMVLLFQPAQWLHIAWLRGYLDTTRNAWQLLPKMLLVGWFTTSGTFAAILALHYWRQAGERELAFQRTQTDMLNLRLALEEQRMLALRAQLEPHFLFNALNAISALVRSGDKPVALGGIGRLSDLLRYALSASVDNSATVAEELRFVRDYLDLQRLRYGSRLQVSIEGADDALHDVDCPPLLLQPLIENALRHDLDCHDGESDIILSFAREDGALLIVVSNQVNAATGANPGAGLGLANTRDRLRLMDPQASLQAGRQGMRFVAEVRLPLEQAR